MPSNGTSGGTRTTIPATSAAPAYTGPAPLACLTAAGLNRARAGVEPQVWEANVGQSAETDANAIVFLSGPYKDNTTASNYAQSLHVVEIATSAGRWVASAALHSNLNAAIDSVAACMAGSG